ncbi:hypothetical protein OAB57_01925 [Bacteriovoracaceae bacterium]|nr:hypothetical protein [Bacteriovoracaceae bacterium]
MKKLTLLINLTFAFSPSAYSFGEQSFEEFQEDMKIAIQRSLEDTTTDKRSRLPKFIGFLTTGDGNCGFHALSNTQRSDRRGNKFYFNQQHKEIRSLFADLIHFYADIKDNHSLIEVPLFIKDTVLNIFNFDLIATKNLSNVGILKFLKKKNKTYYNIETLTSNLNQLLEDWVSAKKSNNPNADIELTLNPIIMHLLADYISIPGGEVDRPYFISDTDMGSLGLIMGRKISIKDQASIGRFSILELHGYVDGSEVMQRQNMIKHLSHDSTGRQILLNWNNIAENDDNWLPLSGLEDPLSTDEVNRVTASLNRKPLYVSKTRYADHWEYTEIDHR